MISRFLAAILFSSLASVLSAQSVVTATVQSAAGGQPYASGNYQVSLVDAFGNPLSVSGYQSQFIGTLSSAGSLSIPLFPNSQIQAGSQWQFHVCSAVPKTLNTPQPSPVASCFSLPVTIQGTGDISSTLAAAAPVFYACTQWSGSVWQGCGTGSSGGGTVNAGTTGQLAYYPGNGTAVSGISRIRESSTILFLGSSAGNATTTAINNTAEGYTAGQSITVGDSNTIYGAQACPALTDARETTCIGSRAGQAYIGNAQGVEDGLGMFIGSLAGYQFPGTGTTDTDIVAIGQKAAESLTSGGASTFLGNHSGDSISSVANSLFFGSFNGFGSGITNATSARDVVIGQDAVNHLVSAAALSDNVIVGYAAGAGQPAPTSDVIIGSQAAAGSTASVTGATIVGFEAAYNIGAAINTAVFGYQAGFNITTGQNTTAVGSSACFHMSTNYGCTAVGSSALYGSTGARNTGIGYQAGSAITTGQDDTFLGWTTQAAAAGDNNEIVIGSQVTGNGSNTTTIGTASTTDTYLFGALHGPAARKGTFVCTAAGTITISNANELVTSDVVISLNTAGGTTSTSPAMKTVSTGTGFTVLCGAADTSTYNYNILN